MPLRNLHFALQMGRAAAYHGSFSHFLSVRFHFPCTCGYILTILVRRFHSTVCLFDIWKRAYKEPHPRKMDIALTPEQETKL